MANKTPNREHNFLSPSCLPLYAHVLKLDAAAHLQLVSQGEAAACLVLLGKTAFPGFVIVVAENNLVGGRSSGNCECFMTKQEFAT